MNPRILRFRVWDPIASRWTGLEVCIGQGYADLSDRDPLIITQFTGLTDSKGRDIYEGDIVSLVHSTSKNPYQGSVVCDNYAWHVNLSGWHVPFAELSKTYSRFETAEIVGNIFESPALLK